MMATFIYIGLFYNSLKVLMPTVAGMDASEWGRVKNIRLFGILLIKCILLNIFSGALVAGIDAGKVYNSWPSMNGQIVPEEAKKITSWRSFFENKALVQFNHRSLAYLTTSVSLGLLYKLVVQFGILPPAVKWAGLVAVGMVNYQAVSGILTLLNLVPPEKANMHQMTAIMTLSSALLLTHVCTAALTTAL